MSGLSKIVIINTSAHATGLVERYLQQLWPVAVSIETTTDTIQEYVRRGPAGPAGNGSSAIATPGNSFSFMSGGFDRYVLDALIPRSAAKSYVDLERAIQTHCLAQFNGYCPTKTASIIDLNQVFSHLSFEKSTATKNGFNHLVLVPTMVVPEPIEDDTLVFDCVWNALLAVAAHNKTETSKISTLVLPVFGTGFGRLDPIQTSQLLVAAVAIFHTMFDCDEMTANFKRAVLVLFVLQKDFFKFGLEKDIAKLENAGITEYGMDMAFRFSRKQKFLPPPWLQVKKCVNFWGEEEN